MNFTAADCDSGNNGLVQYTITSGNHNGHFTISNITGHLITNAILDREEVSEYSLTITAADLGDPSLSSSIEVANYPYHIVTSCMIMYICSFILS